jgi:undecaprenyl-diphosphatase
MTPIQAVILAAVQGITEFLPISSSGHLILVPYFLGWKDQGLAFDIATNTGTLLAIVAYFHRDLRDLIVGFFTGAPRSRDGQFAPRPMALNIVLGTIPAGLAGLLFHDWISTEARNPLLIACTTFFYGLLLWFADRIGRKERALGDVTWRDALIIGIAQAMALVPGTSRSGITITANRFLTFTRDSAARISFLMAIPVTAGAIVFKMAKLISDGIPDGLLGPMIVGIITSGLLGWVAVWGTIKYVRHHSYTPFVIYRVALGLLVLAIYWAR